MADAESVSLKHEVPVLIAATLIVASGVCVEKAQRWLLRWVSPNTVPVVHALFREVSLLGVVALMFFVADRSGLLRSLSLYHFGDPDEMGKLAQSVDLALFMSILAFLLLVVLLLLRAGRRTARRWYAHETAARYPAGLVATYDRLNRSLRSKHADAAIVLPVSATPTPTPTLTPEPVAPGACCGRGVQRPKCCASCRSGARPVALIVYRAMCRRCCRSRNSRAVPTGLEAEVQLEEAEERLVYAALRARFLVRPDDGKGPHSVSAVTQTPKRRRRSIDFTLDELNNPDAIVTLSRDVDTWYRPRDTVHATQLVHKMWLGLDDGDKVGEPGDWMVSGDDGSISLVKPAEFAKLFEPVEGEPGRFRSTRRVLARCMGHSYVCRTASGKLKRGTPGSYLVQDLDGHADAGDDEDGAVAQFVMTKLEFASAFESMVPDVAELVQSAEDTTSLLHLPLDFDFGLYLSTVYAKTVAHIVELDWPAWVAVQVILVTLWGIHVIVQKAVLTHILVAGYVLVLCTIAVWYKLRWARRMLTAMDAIRRFRDADPTTTPAADAFASIGVSSWGLSASGGTSIGGSSAISGVTGRPTPTGWGEKRPAGGDSAKPPRAPGKSDVLTSVSSFWSAPNSGPVRGPSLPRLRSITMGDSCSTDITGATRRSSVGVDDRLAVPVADSQNDLLDWRGRQRIVSPVQEGTPATASAGCSTPLDGDADDAKPTAARSRTSSSVAAASAGSAADRDAAGSPSGAALHSRSLRHITGSSGRVPEGVMFIQPGSGRGTGALLDDFVDGSAPQPARAGTTTVDYGHSVRGFVESSRVTGSNSLFAHTAAKVLAMKIRAQVRRATNQDVANLRAPDTLTKALDKPPFEQMRLRRHGFCASCCCCRGRGLWKPTSRQQQLLWCGSAGVRVTTVIIQLLLLLCSAFVSVSLTMLISEDGPCWIGHDKFPVLRCCMWTGAVAVPPTFIMIIIPSIVGMFAVITNVEEMVKPDAIREVIQTQYTTQAMRALRMLSALALNATHEYKRQQQSLRKLQSRTPRSARVRPQRSLSPKHSMVVMTPAVLTGAEAVYGERDSADYVRRRAEVLDVFGLFDRELKGYITVDNMRSLLKQLGVRHMTEELLLDMMKSLDLNGDGHIGFDVFFEWIARQDRKVSDDSATSSVTAFMFGLIDTDGVGFVTVDSLRHALSCLGAFVRYDDLTRMMLVFDTSDTGQLSLPDFKRLLKEQNKFNKWLM